MTWTLQDNQYTWTETATRLPVQIRVNAQQPLAGIETPDDLPIDQWFAIHGLPVGDISDAEWFQRGSDLSMNLPYSAQRPTGCECYWRASTDERRLGMEFWFSANTRLLDEQIECHAHSRLRISQVQLIDLDPQGMMESTANLEPGAHSFVTDVGTGDDPVGREKALLCTLKDSDYHLLLAGYPGDQSRLELNWKGDELEIWNHLNFGFLEKGVIRRARLYAELLPAIPGLLAEAERGLNQFYHSPLPLTV